MARYHITKKGEPGVCKAQAGNCPLAGEGEHFDSADEAREAYEAKQGGSFDQPALFDVKNETEFIMTEVAAEKLRKGDDYEGSPITDVQVGRKWVTIATEAKPKSLELVGERVVVQREVETEAARQAQEAEYKEELTARNVKTALAGFDAAVEKMNESITKYGRVDDHHFTRLMESQAKKEIAEQVQHRVETQGVSYNEAAEGLRAYYKEQLSDYLIKTGLSRSTSVMHNAMEDAKNEAILSFVRDRYFW